MVVVSTRSLLLPHTVQQAIADALGVPDKGRQLVEAQQRQLEAAANSAKGRGSLRVACVQWPQPLMAAGAWVPELIQVRGRLWGCAAKHLGRSLACRQCDSIICRIVRCGLAVCRLGCHCSRSTCSCLPASPLPQMTGSRDVIGSQDHAELVSEQQLAEAQPDVLVFALCGLTLEQSTRAAQAAVRRLAAVWQRLPAAQAGRVAVVDGEHVFSRPGPLLVQSLECLVEMLHPEAQQAHQGKLWRWLPSAS